MTTVACARAGEVLESAVARTGPVTLSADERAAVLGCTITLSLQVNEMLQAGMVPGCAAAMMQAKCIAVMRLLGLPEDDMRAVFDAARTDIGRAGA